jgi:hypothetical protein
MTAVQEGAPDSKTMSLRHPEPFNTVCEMEDDVTAATQLADATALMLPSLDQDLMNPEEIEQALWRLIRTLKRHLVRIEERRDRLFHMTHSMAYGNPEAGEAAS